MYPFLNKFFGLIAFIVLVLVFCVDHIHAQPENENTLILQSGKVHFVSDAPLELIEATSTDFRAVIDTVSGKFAFSIPISSFLGFNSELQRTHFNENYMETNRFANATYAGKIIESWKTPGIQPHDVRTKGQLTIHGETTERLIPAQIIREGDRLRVKAMFKVPVSEHSIKIPKLVTQKIASEITVTVDAIF